MDERAVDRLEEALYGSANRAGAGEMLHGDEWVQLTTPAARTEYRNGIFRSVLAPDEVDGRIDAVIEHFARFGVPFRWFVTPSTRPTDMGARLERRGFEHSQVLEGLVARPAAFAEPDRPDVQVIRLAREGMETYLEVQQRGWDMPAAAVERFRAEMQVAFAAQPRRRYYFLAVLAGTPAGTGSLSLYDSGFAHFDGADVVPALRRRGVYRELILERMRFLRERGIDLVTNHCVSTTSAPICRALGFEKACEFQVYRYEA